MECKCGYGHNNNIENIYNPLRCFSFPRGMLQILITVSGFQVDCEREKNNRYVCGILSSFNVSASSCKRCTRPRPALMWDPTRLLHAGLVPAVIHNFQPFSVLCAPLAVALRFSVLRSSVHQPSSNACFQLPSLFISSRPRGHLVR